MPALEKVGSYDDFSTPYGGDSEVLSEYTEELAKQRRDLATELGISEEELHCMGAEEINLIRTQVASSKN